MTTNEGKFAFLSSTRFWAIVLGALAIYLQSKGIIGDPEMLLIATISGGFTIVRTVDRTADRLGTGYTDVSGSQQG